jgi:phenylalanyl-tRNA synthetase beta chain
MLLSRKWLNEFVEVDLGDRDFAEAMTLSGSKQETTEYLGEEIKNVVVGRIVSIEKHPDSDHMFVVMMDVGEKEPIQICTGAWNIHVGDVVPVARHNALLPGGKKIERGKLRGVMSDGMLCSLKELGLDTHDFWYGVIKPAALLNNYKPLDPAKPSIPAGIKPGDKVFGSVVCAGVKSVKSAGINLWDCVLDLGGEEVSVQVDYQNIHEWDLVAFDKKTGKVLGLDDLRAEQKEFPNCIDDGIFIMHEPDAVIGADILPVIGKDDHVVDFEITPNRPDCLCMIGLAREAAVTFGKKFVHPVPVVRAEAGGDINELAKVFVEDPLCVRYTARMVKNVKIAPSPKWMRQRIRACGMRPINNIVDITNYVMMEYGQPMHAFDFSCVNNHEIHVRRARAGETIQTLDGNQRALSESMLCICDTDKPVGVAGVMGGANSEIVGDTAMVLFESANFNGASIRRTATALGMRTDASARYEKGLDPDNTMAAVQRACELVELLGAGEVVEGVIDVYPDPVKETTVKLEPDKINALLGTDVDRGTMEKILLDLGFGLDGDTIHVPSWRGDVEHYSDIAEEVARFYGYNNIPVKFSGGNTRCGGYTELQQAERLAGSMCRTFGMDEIITYSFISPAYYDKIRLPADSKLRDSLKILNPLGEDTSIMRTTTLPSMLEILTRNYNFRNKSARLYELGRIYFKRPDGLADEPKVLSMGAYGEGLDFYVMKGWIEALLRSFRTAKPVFEPETENPSYHPGRCAKVYVGQRCIGVFGQVHPKVMENYGVDADMYCAELSFADLYDARGAKPVYRPLPRFPSIHRDIAIVCDADISAAKIEDCITQAGGGYLKDVELFDIYTGVHIADGKKSMAFSLTMRADDQTLTDDHADEIVTAVLAALKEKYGASIR